MDLRGARVSIFGTFPAALLLFLFTAGPSRAAAHARHRARHEMREAWHQIPCSIMVKVSACHAEDPVSIAGGGFFSLWAILDCPSPRHC